MPKPTAIKESEVLTECKALLEQLKAAGILDFWRINMGASFVRGVKTKNSGMAGFSDLMILFKNHEAAAFVELKATKGTQSDEQAEFQRRVERMGHKYFIVRSVSEMTEILPVPPRGAVSHVPVKKG